MLHEPDGGHTRSAPRSGAEHSGRVLVVDQDRDVGELVYAVLTDSGYSVSLLFQLSADAIRAAVGRIEPDCVLLDAENAHYGESWAKAALLHSRSRRVPVIMFSTRKDEMEEGEARVSGRSRAADFAGVVSKPFDVEKLLVAVAKAVGHSVRFDPSPQADAARTQALVERLRALGAHDIGRSTHREWVTFHFDGGLLQLYWWRRGGCYYVGRYPKDGSVMENVGRFYDLDSAIECALLTGRSEADPDTSKSEQPA